MRHDQLERMPCPPRLSPEEARHAGLRQRLTKVCIDAGTEGNIYVNGERFKTSDLKFVLDNFQCPKPK